MKNKKKIFLFLLILAFIYLIYLNVAPIFLDLSSHNLSFGQTSNYDVIKEDINKNYSGIGQEKVKNKDGYFTTFTTNGKNPKTYREYKQNGNSSWSKNTYWNGTMAENGCGITSLSIILSGYEKYYSPEKLRKKYYPVLDSQTISDELSSTFGISNSDFYYDDVHLSKKSLEKHLQKNKPILVCVWNKPENNRWTTASHYMVLLATDGKGMVYVSNPNGLEKDSKSSGWYNWKEVTPYIAKALYVEE